MLPVPHPLGGPRGTPRALGFHPGPPPFAEQWAPPWFSRCEAVGKTKSCLSVSLAKPKAPLARRLEPASWGQRSPSEASWHPGAMAAGGWGVSSSGGRQWAGQPSSGKLGPAAAATRVSGGCQCLGRVPFPGHCSPWSSRAVAWKERWPFRMIASISSFPEVVLGAHRAVGRHLAMPH